MAGKKSSKPQRYVENEDHVPNPTYQTGTVDTTGTGGDAAADPNAVSPVFAQARAAALGAAVEAIEDPNQDETRVVSLPEEELTRDDAIAKVEEAAEEAKNNPQLTEGLTPGAQEAAEEQEQSAPGRKPAGQAAAKSPARSQKDSGNK